jgi:hypothetical protein
LPYYSVFSARRELGLVNHANGAATHCDSHGIPDGEELGWGDAGLGVSLRSRVFRKWRGDRQPGTVELCQGRIGCWMITHPTGGDVTMVDIRQWPAGQRPTRATYWRGRLQGDEIVINGQCSAWV